MATIGSLMIEVGATLAPLQRELNRIPAMFRGMEQQLRKIQAAGQALSATVSAPLAAAGPAGSVRCGLQLTTPYKPRRCAQPPAGLRVVCREIARRGATWEAWRSVCEV